MESAADALQLSFIVFVFVMALTITITMFTQLNQVSTTVLASTDFTNFYDYQLAIDHESERIVGLETIIPTLYKYYKENYTVLFLDAVEADGKYKPLPLYDSQTDRDNWGKGLNEDGTNDDAGIIGKYYANNSDDNPVCAFDVDEEQARHEPWEGKNSDFKANLDKFLQGGIFEYPSGAKNEDGSIKAYNYTNNYLKKGSRGGFIAKYGDRKFKEFLGEYTYNLLEEDENEEDPSSSQKKTSNDLIKNRKKRIIIYQLQN